MVKWLKRLGVAFLLLCVLLVVVWLCRAPLLRGAANAWIVNEPLTKADVIVVLGGGVDTRPIAAARLYHLGLAPKILLMNPKPSPSTRLGLLPADADLSRDILLKADVSADDIIIATDIVTNSFDESVCVRNWAKAHGANRMIIPTDIFHTRRVRWLYRKELKSTGIQVQTEGVPVLDYTASDWWQHEQGVIAFQNEILKFAYYRLKY